MVLVIFYKRHNKKNHALVNMHCYLFIYIYVGPSIYYSTALGISTIKEDIVKKEERKKSPKCVGGIDGKKKTTLTLNTQWILYPLIRGFPRGLGDLGRMAISFRELGHW